MTCFHNGRKRGSSYAFKAKCEKWYFFVYHRWNLKTAHIFSDKIKLKTPKLIQVKSKAVIFSFSMILSKDIEIEICFRNKICTLSRFHLRWYVFTRSISMGILYMFGDKLFLPLCLKVRSIGCVFVASLSIDSLQKALTD